MKGSVRSRYVQMWRAEKENNVLLDENLLESKLLDQAFALRSIISCGNHTHMLKFKPVTFEENLSSTIGPQTGIEPMSLSLHCSDK